MKTQAKTVIILSFLLEVFSFNLNSIFAFKIGGINAKINKNVYLKTSKQVMEPLHCEPKTVQISKNKVYVVQSNCIIHIYKINAE